MKKFKSKINFCTVLGLILVIAGFQQVIAEDQIEPFDNNFVIQDIYVVKDDFCDIETQMNFKSFAKKQFQQHFNKLSADLIQYDHDDYAIFIKPFDLPFEDLLPFTTLDNNYSRYRLIVMAMYPEVMENSCMLGFGIFPEAWDGERWIRFKSNKQLEKKLFKDYLEEQNNLIFQN